LGVNDASDQQRSLDSVSLSDRDRLAEGRDREAEERDVAAHDRDGLAADGSGERSIERSLAALDRTNAARDRASAAADRESARHELAFAGIDDLTGAMNRRAGLVAIQHEMDRAERSGEALTVAFVDTVGLKAVNDTKGHAAGDRMLEAITDCIRADLRPYDLLVRVGGDEFVSTHLGQAVAQVSSRYEKLSDHLAADPEGARMAVGLAAHVHGDSLGDLVGRADQAMLAGRRHSPRRSE
jgi:diguanylate cyclase (GGDEF)-like protein